MSKRSCEAAESIEDASFANGACERTANAKTLRKDRTASEWKDVAFATRRCVLFFAQGRTFFFTVYIQNDKM